MSIEEIVSKWQSSPNDTDFQLVLKQFAPLINKFANKYNAPDRDDIRQVAEISLFDAMRTYNPSKSKFITHFYNYINGQTSIELSRQTNFNKYYNRTYEDYKKPSFKPVEDALNLGQEDSKDQFDDLIKFAPERYQDMLIDKYKLGMTLQQIGRKNSISKETVRKEINKALKILRARLNNA